MNNTVLSLFELNRMVKNTLSESFHEPFWIRAETSDVRESQNGHCYLEFIEKDNQNKAIVAKARGSIWANIYRMLKMYFEKETGQAFSSGIKVLILVSVEFHEAYGFSLNVHNIDPSYTLGDQAKNRVLIIKQLEKEGVLNLNKELKFESITNRIAVISSPTAAGYEDFQNQLKGNKSGFVFYTKLFPAIMQGEKTEDSILSALDRTNEFRDYFDAVVIIRGGGATSELSAFDSYLLATSCAQFPLPIITGIGHERDDTVLDIVANTRVKTPTAAAEFLINKMTESDDDLTFLQNRIVESVNNILISQRLNIETLTTHLSYIVKGKTKEQLAELSKLEIKLANNVNHFLQSKKHMLESKEQHLTLINPQNILKKGYTLTTKDNKIIKSAQEISPGEHIKTLFSDGEIASVAQ